MVDLSPHRLRELGSSENPTSLSDMQPSVLRSASFSPLLDAPLDHASSRVEQVIETMASYRGAKTPQLDQVPRQNPQGALKDIIRVGCKQSRKTEIVQFNVLQCGLEYLIHVCMITSLFPPGR